MSKAPRTKAKVHKPNDATSQTPVSSEWLNFNLNQYVMVKLTDRGKEIHRKTETELLGKNPTWTYKAPAENESGWSKWQLWDLMATFGEFISMGSMPPFETEIRIKP